jgi:hypothetical protein
VRVIDIGNNGYFHNYFSVDVTATEASAIHDVPDASLTPSGKQLNV